VTARPRGKGKGVTPRPRPDDGQWRDDWNTPAAELDLVRNVAGTYVYSEGAKTSERVPARILFDPCWNRSAITNPVRACWVESPTPARRDGLIVSWRHELEWLPAADGYHDRPGVIFVNPPYSALEAWLAKCAAEARGVTELGHYIVALVPARVEQPCWTDIIHTTSLIAFRHGRVTFDHPEGKKASSAPMPIALLIWSPFCDGKERRAFGGMPWWCAEAVRS
jgi:hypothetical protein